MGKLNEWADSDREQAAVIRYLVALGEDSARGDLSHSQADTLDATAEGWDTIAQASDDQVDDPDQH